MTSSNTLATLVIIVAGVAPAFAQPVNSSPTRCVSARAPFGDSLDVPQWNGWGADPSQRRFQPAERARLAADAVPRLTLKWAFGFPGAAAASGQPTVVNGRLFVGSADGTVYSLGADTGCVIWTYKAGAPVRTAISVGRVGGAWAVYFGDLQAYAYALDLHTGTVLWKTRVDEHPGARITGAPTLAGGRLYVPASSAEEGMAADPKYPCCTFRGSVSSLDAATGAVIWKSYTIRDEPKPTLKNKLGVQMSGPSGAAVWSSPTVDLENGMVFVTTGDSYSLPAAPTSDAFVAFEMKTGRLLWWRQTTAGDVFTVDCDFPEHMRGNCPAAHGPDHDFGSSPVLVTLAAPGGC